MKSNPRFVWNIGAIAEEFPDMPEQTGEIVLWDRQTRAPVVTIAAAYGQAFCLETTHTEGSQPFTTLETWLNSLTPSELRSEGITGTRKPFTVNKR